MSKLFRQQVIERQTDRLHGEILILPRVSHSLILSFIVLWVAVLVYWLCTNNYARKETVLGWLEPPQGVTRIYAEGTGIIKQVLVREGDSVVPGQPLIIVTAGHFLADGDQLEVRLLKEYKSQQNILKQQLALTSNIYQRRQQDISGRLTAADDDFNLLVEQIDTLNQRYQLAQALVVRNQDLQQQGYVSATALEQLISQQLGLHNEQQALLREQVSQANAQTQLTSELESLPDQAAGEEAQLRARLSEVAQKITQLQGQSAHVIKATCACSVNNVQAHVGDKVYAGSNLPLLTIYPSASQLSVHLLVPVRSAGFVEPGQSLDLRYDAFPYQKFGLYSALVESISDTVLMPNELLNTPLQVDEPVYRIKALLQQQTVQAYGKDFLLKAGMSLSADVHLDERSLLQWLMEPLHSLRGHL